MKLENALITGKYRVVKKLGEGAMGSVWLAKNEVTDREFAIKVLKPEVASEPQALARFFREARVCGSLRHPSILEIYDAGTAPELGGAGYLVMERLDGAPLDAVIEQRGALDMRLALDILIQCSRGLHLAHEKGIIHRDIKPANIFLHRPGTGSIEPKVLDFGISKVLNPADPNEIALTQSATVMGSPLYMSPEQMEMKALTARSDVHALGVVLWECLVGRPPFAAKTYNSLVVEVLRDVRPKLTDALPRAPRTLESVVAKAFAIDPNERFASTLELANALEIELASLGGGVLASRTAAEEVLEPLRVQIERGIDQSGAMRSTGDRQVGVADTAAATASVVPTGRAHRERPAGASTRYERSLKRYFIGSIVLVSAAAGILAVALRGASTSAVVAPSSSVASASSTPPPSVPPAPLPAPSEQPTAAALPTLPAFASSAPTLVASAAPTIAHVPLHTSASALAPTHPAATATAVTHAAAPAKPSGKSVVDESGL